MAETKVYQCPHCPRTFSSPNGLSGHIGGAHRKKSKPAPASVEKAIPRTLPDSGKFKCPECPRIFAYARALGKHRSMVHGIPGMSAGAIAKRNQQQNAQPVSFESAHAPTHKRQATAENGHVSALDPVLYGLAVGSVQEFCRHFAEEHDLPARVFTRQFAELFLRQARR